MKKALVTGDFGYISSFTVVELQQNGYEVVIIDNLVNSRSCIQNRIEQITSISYSFYKADLCDREAITNVFPEKGHFDVGIHFIALKAFETENKLSLNYSIGNKREGDVAVTYADVTKATNIPGRKTQKRVERNGEGCLKVASDYW